MFSSSQRLSETSVRLTGLPAVDWLTERGLRVGNDPTKTRIVADAARAPNFAIARLWIDAPDVDQPGLQAEGIAIIIATEDPLVLWPEGDQQYVLDKGDAAIIPRSLAINMRADSSVALIQIHLEDAFFTRFALQEVEVLRVARVNSSPVLILASLVNATLATMSHMELNWAHSKVSVEASAATVVAMSEIPNRIPPVSGSKIYDTALLIIYDQVVDPQFSVMVLASMLSISKRRVEQVFALHGDSPSVRIRRIRLQAAMKILSQYSFVDSVKFAEVARVSGFRSPRALRDALRGQRQGLVDE